MLSFDRKLAYVFLGAAMIAAIELCVNTDLPGNLWLSSVCFLIAIPVLTLAIVMGLIDDDIIGQSLLATLSYNAVKVTGLLITLAGFGFLFLHRSGFLGIAYFVIVVVAIATYWLWWEIIASEKEQKRVVPNNILRADVETSPDKMDTST